MCFSSFIQTLPTSHCLQWRNSRFCNMLFDVTSVYWKSLCKMPSALFLLEHFSFIELWTKFFNRIAGKLMNIKKIKLFDLTNTWHILLIQAVNSWRSSEVFTIVCCKCHWTCVLTKCVFLHVVFSGTRVNSSVDFCDSFMWCNHLICKLERNFTCICKLTVYPNNFYLPLSLYIDVVC